MVVDVSGRVSEVLVVECDEPGFGFEDAIREHVLSAFRFDPAIEDGAPIERRIRWTHRFRLDD
jgi:hypothetical protein